LAQQRDVERWIESLTRQHGAAAAASDEGLAAVSWLAQTPAEYQSLVRRFGAHAIDLWIWTFPPVEALPQSADQLRRLGAPPALVPFATTNGNSDFAAFDLGGQAARIVHWYHDDRPEPFAGSFTDWIASVLGEQADARDEEAEYRQNVRRWHDHYVPFCDSAFGKAVISRLTPDARGARLRDVLLDLHLQYTFQPYVVARDPLRFAGLLHFAESDIGCWRCGAISRRDAAERQACSRCGEPLLLLTFAHARAQKPRPVSRPAFADWAAPHLSLDDPHPVVVTDLASGKGIPFWARLHAFGGTRDPTLWPAS
jgi:hypothetical protein